MGTDLRHHALPSGHVLGWRTEAQVAALKLFWVRIKSGQGASSVLWVPAVGTTDMIVICVADRAEPAHPGEWPQARELGLEGGYKFGCFTYESDPDKWKAAGCPRCLWMA